MTKIFCDIADIRLIKKFNKKKIVKGFKTNLNITAVYNSIQSKKILKIINKKNKVVISIFAGRMADVGKDPLPEFKKSLKYSRRFPNVEILWASTREPYNFLQAKKLRCHIITVPPKIIEKIEKFGKSFNNLTLETVNGFLIDSNKSKFKL